ncbi:hypothetical protein Pcinc_018066 [Petrolisthes cinctipes]|uniref:Uncharacterized protein n=1 Tax=Petrolisthes cinctipes TaxID=88211 RepID=A0AAE1FN25_PETCI|nr:hypothetical protein Pcinc_018066 [Petrolisthes cinctipes]
MLHSPHILVFSITLHPPPPSPIRTTPLLHPLPTPTSSSSSSPSPYTPTSFPYKNPPPRPNPLDFSPLPDPRLTKNSGGESGGRLARNSDMN